MNDMGPRVTVEQALELETWLARREREMRGRIKTLENNIEQIRFSRLLWMRRAQDSEMALRVKNVEVKLNDPAYTAWCRCTESQIRADRRRAQERGAEKHWWRAALLFTALAGILLVVAAVTGHI